MQCTDFFDVDVSEQSQNGRAVGKSRRMTVAACTMDSVVPMAAVLLASMTVVAGLEDGPCDIYSKGGTPCVAAHSLTRALYATYNGPLYALQKGGDVQDIGVVTAGGIADAAAHNAFCSAETCVVHRIYDQSPMQNHLGIEHGASNLAPPRNAQVSHSVAHAAL
jgi:hypothetical protein